MNTACTCCVCREQFESIHSLEVHIATNHVFYTPYECEICTGALFPTDQSLREHYARIHQKRVFNIKYKVSPELDQRRDLLRQLMEQSRNQPAALANIDIYQLVQEQMSQTLNMLRQPKVEKEDVKMENVSDAMENNTQQEEPSYVMVEECEQSSSFELNANIKRFLDSANAAISFGKMSQDGVQNDAEMEAANIQLLLNTSMASSGESPHKKRGRRKRTDPSANQEEINEEGPTVECVECKRKVGKYRNSMLIHTSTHHCAEPIFECLGDNCTKKWYSLSARTKEHIDSKHKGDISLLKDNRAELLPVLKAKTGKLFPQFYSIGSSAKEEESPPHA